MFKVGWLGVLQVEGSTVWIPTPPPQDMGLTAGIPTNSYYNLAGQGHHNPYSLPQLSAHTHMHPGTVYPTNLYHPSQLGPTTTKFKITWTDLTTLVSWLVIVSSQDGAI